MIIAISAIRMKPDSVEFHKQDNVCGPNKGRETYEFEFTEIGNKASGFMIDFDAIHLEYIHEAIEIALGMKPTPCDCNKNDKDPEKIACLTCEDA